MLAEPLVHVEKQSVPIGVPARRGLEVHSVVLRTGDPVQLTGRTRDTVKKGIIVSRAAGRVRGKIGHREVYVLASCAPRRVVHEHLSLGLGLIDVVKASQVHALDTQITDADRGVLERIEFDCETGLYPVRVLVVLVDAYDRRRPKNATSGDRNACSGSKPWRARCGRLGIGAVGQHLIDSERIKASPPPTLTPLPPAFPTAPLGLS